MGACQNPGTHFFIRKQLSDQVGPQEEPAGLERRHVLKLTTQRDRNVVDEQEFVELSHADCRHSIYEFSDHHKWVCLLWCLEVYVSANIHQIPQASRRPFLRLFTHLFTNLLGYVGTRRRECGCILANIILQLKLYLTQNSPKL